MLNLAASLDSEDRLMTELNVEQARYNMVEQQVRPWDVLDQTVLDLFGRSPREDYVPAAYKNLAYADTEIPIGHDQVMLTPRLEGRILQALDVKPTDKTLVIGTGSGYLVSLLAQLCKEVVAVDINADFTAMAQKNLGDHGINNVTLETGDAARGWDKGAPYDAIVLTGSTPVLPDSIRESLAVGGRLFAVVGQAPVMEAMLIVRTGQASWSESDLFETELPPLTNAVQVPKFTF